MCACVCVTCSRRGLFSIRLRSTDDQAYLYQDPESMAAMSVITPPSAAIADVRGSQLSVRSTLAK